MTTILGLNAYHGDAAACLVRDGALVAAAEEERFRRIKHWAGFPVEAIRYCLDEAGIGLGDLDHVAINRDPRANLWRKIGYTAVRRPSVSLVRARLRNARQWAGVESALGEAFPGAGFQGRVHHVEHHLAHLCSAFLASPFSRAVAVSIDGFGDFASAAWGIGEGSDVSVEGRVMFPHSLGLFYQAITQYLGFPDYGDEYKVMGLAPYGKPSHMAEMGAIVRLRNDGTFRLKLRYFRHHREDIAYQWQGGTPSTGTVYAPALEKLLGPARAPGEPIEARHRDIARSAQAMFEEAVFHLYDTLHKRHGVEALVIAGGCAFNSAANGRICLNTPFERVYVQPAAGDAGGAVGAALHVAAGLDGGLGAGFVMDHADWGPGFDDAEIAAILAARRDELERAGCAVDHMNDEATLCERTAREIAGGGVVGWFQGRMEWGPRALGNRSILADPRRADMKDILNAKIKRRESFRPFAPSVLREAVANWFETDADAPFMMTVARVRKPRRGQIPAVTHVDGTGRLQTVHRHTNPRYHRLISAFGAITGVPMVLNTSFNENEPVVCRPEEALDCFLRTRMDALVLGDYFVARDGVGRAA